MRYTYGIRPIVCWVVLGSALLTSHVAQAQQASVHGRVMGQTEAAEHLGPVSQAEVEFLQNGKRVARTQSTDNGYYQIEGLQPGKYEYHLTAAGFREEKEGRGFELKAAGASVLDFVVTKESSDKEPKEDRPKNRKNKKPANGDGNSPVTPPAPPSATDPNSDAAPPSGQGALVVRVALDNRDNVVAIPGTKITVRNSEGGPIQESSPQQGVSRFHVLPGTWRAHVSAPGYPPQCSAPVTVPQNDRAFTTIVLLSKSDEAAVPTKPDSNTPTDETQATFFGAKAKGNRIAYLVDSSFSMRGGKFDKAAAELKKSIRSLSDSQQFYVVFFSDTLHPMFEPHAPADMMPANWLNVVRLERSLTDLQLRRGTNAHEAAQKVVDLKPDAIYILSDGAFTDDARGFLMQMKNTIPIHTIGFSSKERAANYLKALSDRHHGTYTEIP